jgi:hypothetical protein
MRDFENLNEIGGEQILKWNKPDGFESMIHSLIRFCWDFFRYSFIQDDIHSTHTMKVIETSKTGLLAFVPKKLKMIIQHLFAKLHLIMK